MKRLATPWAVVILIAAVTLLYFVITGTADAQFFGFGGGSDDMVCTIDGEPVDCPTDPSMAEAHEDKLTHALGAVYLIVGILLLRLVPVLRALVSPHYPVGEAFEKVLCKRYGNPNTKAKMSDAESRAFVAMTVKDTLSYAVVVLAMAWVMSTL